MKINVCRLKSQTEKLDQVSVLLFFFSFCHSLHRLVINSKFCR